MRVTSTSKLGPPSSNNINLIPAAFEIIHPGHDPSVSSPAVGATEHYRGTPTNANLKNVRSKILISVAIWSLKPQTCNFDTIWVFIFNSCDSQPRELTMGSSIAALQGGYRQLRELLGNMASDCRKWPRSHLLEISGSIMSIWITEHMSK